MALSARFLLCCWLASAFVWAQTAIPAGTRLAIRLHAEISSRKSAPGDPVIATLIAPVNINGRNLIPAGLCVRGEVIEPGEAHKKLDHRVLDLKFGELVDAAGKAFPFSARVFEVDNGRESVDQQGVIHGLRPIRRRPDQLEDLLMLAAYAHPAALASLEAGKFLVAETEKPRVSYPPGVELWLELTAPMKLTVVPRPAVLRLPAELRPSPELLNFVQALPLRTSAANGAASDLLNLLFVGSADNLVDGFAAAGWSAAEKLSVKTEAATFLAVAAHHSYREGPVSTLLVGGRKPDYVFEKENNTFSKRHHIRIWRSDQRLYGMPVWIGAATHDIGIVFSRKARTFSHSVANDIDDERGKVVNDLTFAGAVVARALVSRPNAPHSFQNATGDHLETDGAIAMLRLGTLSTGSKSHSSMEPVSCGANSARPPAVPVKK